ncbi:MAG TPA: alpha/beta hydrolase [Opitutaceae bacterium]|nr:alpha/beta hydrolase [Opitutaceae bacterium]
MKNRSLLLSLLAILIGTVGAWWIQTDGGAVQVTGIRLPTEAGQWITADLYRPRAATAAHPVPLVVVCPGFERSKETMDSYAIELARRDIAVVVIDPYNQGASSGTRAPHSVITEGNGLAPMLDFLVQGSRLDYIDRARVGLAGYSAGANAALQTAARADAPGQPRVEAVFAGGYVLSLTPKLVRGLHCNIGIDYAEFDEGSYRTVRGNADLRHAPEAIRLVTSGGAPDEKVESVEIGRYYGSAAQGTLRVVYNTGPQIHPLLPYDPRHIARLLTFFGRAFGLQFDLPPGRQTWMWKEVFGGITLIGFLSALVPATALLLRLPWFRTLVHPVPPPLPAPSRGGRVLFWINFAVSAGFAAWVFVPMIHATAPLFPAASASHQTWWFPERMNNAILLWAVINGVLGFGIFAAVYLGWGRRHGTVPAMWGAGLTWGEAVRAVALAALVIAGFYAGVFGLHAWFHVDPRLLFISAPADFPPRLLLVVAEYLPLFFIFYLANSLRVNGAGRFAGQSEAGNRLVMALANSVGLMLILVVQYTALFWHGTVFWTKEWIYMDLLFGVVPMMFILPYYHRAFFRLTGRIYVGPLITCGVFILMLLTSNVCYLPTP